MSCTTFEGLLYSLRVIDAHINSAVSLTHYVLHCCWKAGKLERQTSLTLPFCLRHRSSFLPATLPAEKLTLRKARLLLRFAASTLTLSLGSTSTSS